MTVTTVTEKNPQKNRGSRQARRIVSIAHACRRLNSKLQTLASRLVDVSCCLQVRVSTQAKINDMKTVLS